LSEMPDAMKRRSDQHQKGDALTGPQLPSSTGRPSFREVDFHRIRFALSRGQGTAGLLTVVFTGLPRTTTASPICFINRAVEQRAASIPSRHNCLQILRTP
jgi:hypothetical protein